ncbi:hypothetical protein AMELA_G00084260 [Ameiurus melas]|uniref:C2H2-type domain-containing protein n=1 Tax=Ameiurus melas TaxID=219545 RepID=A0A7J6B4B9_AMEME|nr:hypothetical protein AMELA_G00084260 [Ameiurus melas]
MEIACEEMARAVGAALQRDEITVDECTVTLRLPKLESSSEDEDVSEGFGGDVCCMCRGRVAFLDHQPEHLIKQKDEACCHLCQTNFSHVNSLALHLKTAHPEYHIFCKHCKVYMGRHLTKEWTADTDKTPETPKEEPLDEEVEEVIIENEYVEIKYVKEEEEEVVVGKMGEREENSVTETPEDNQTVTRTLHDHTYFSTHPCSSIKDTTNNAVMYSSSENVLVFINETDTRTSPEDSYMKSEQQETPVDDPTACRGVRDHTYSSIQNLANPMLLARQVLNSSSENMDAFNNKSDAPISPKDPESTESEQDRIWKHELMCRGLLDHSYFSRQILANHTAPSEQVPSVNTRTSSIHNTSKEKWMKIQNPGSNVTMTDQGTTEHSSAPMVESSQLEYNVKVEDDLCGSKPVQEDVVKGDEERIRRRDHEDADSSPTDNLQYESHDDSDTVSCTSTDYNCDTLEEDCAITSWSACPKPCEIASQKSLDSVDAVNSNPASSLYKDLQIRTSRSKGPKTEKSMKLYTCLLFKCSLCGSVFVTEEKLLNHQVEKHPLAKYVCVRCLKLFPKQSVFLRHVCSMSKGFRRESLSPSNNSDKTKEPLHTFLNLAPSPAATESSKQPHSSQSVNVINPAKHLGTVSKSTSHSLPNSPSTQKVPVQVMATRSSSAEKKKVTHLVLNENQGQVMTPISAVTQNQIGQVQVLSLLQANVVTRTPSFSTSTLSSSSSTLSASSPSSSSTSSSSTSSTSSPSSSSSSSSSPSSSSSSQGQGQMTSISTVSQRKSVQMQDLTPLQSRVVAHTPSGSAALTVSIVLPQNHSSFGVHLPHPLLTQASSSNSIPSQTGQQPESNVPFLDICRSSPSTQILPSSQAPLKIVAMFVNQSKELALQKRMRQSWRAKAVFPCRQCGAVSRQFSLGVRHRYQHRGPRLHRCQCGRAFQQRMHLLRHQVQHAEATRYVCAACGQMFCGTQKLACHRPLFRVTPTNKKRNAQKECRNMFQCYCGLSFTRPAALLWHLLKNSKTRKKRLKVSDLLDFA